jgi:hypothetical protein
MINTKILLSTSAVVLGLFGFLSSFFSQELLLHTKVTSDGAADMFIQLLAALFIGFAIMNWMNRGVIMGGIYARPLAMGNFSHFLHRFYNICEGFKCQTPSPGDVDFNDYLLPVYTGFWSSNVFSSCCSGEKSQRVNRG